MKDKIQIILPPTASSDRDFDLVNLTEYLGKKFDLDGGFGLGGEFGYGVDYRNDTFVMRPYFWGDCTCGWGAFEYKGRHEKNCFRNKYKAYERQLKKEKVKWLSGEWIKTCGEWAKANGNKRGWAGSGAFCNCSYEKRFKKWFDKNKKGIDGHAETCELILPNFHYFKSDLKIDWYKWIGRDMKYSRKITDKEWRSLLEDCIKSIGVSKRKEKLTMKDKIIY